MGSDSFALNVVAFDAENTGLPQRFDEFGDGPCWIVVEFRSLHRCFRPWCGRDHQQTRSEQEVRRDSGIFQHESMRVAQQQLPFESRREFRPLRKVDETGPVAK